VGLERPVDPDIRPTSGFYVGKKEVIPLRFAKDADIDGSDDPDGK
jgi:hypothetical protein